MSASDIQISNWISLADTATPAWLRMGATAVFREAATSWPSDPKRAEAFTELWLDGYLREEPDLAFVALDPWVPGPSDNPMRVVGYLVASIADPRVDPRFADLGYFADFAGELVAFPAHLHLNVRAANRGQRIGERLIAAAMSELASRGCKGVHIVTGSASRNVGFYRRCGFVEHARTLWNGRDLVLMGRPLQT